MKLKEYKVLGHVVQYNVTESSTEFNALDPKRSDAANDEAVANFVYRSMNPETRYIFLHGRDAVAGADGKPGVTAIEGVEAQVVGLLDGVTLDPADEPTERKTEVAKNKKGEVRKDDSGAEITKYVEAEEEYYKRALALLVKYKKFTGEDAARANFDSLIKQIAAEVPFDVTAPERTERGPKKLAAKYKLAAAKVIALGNVAAVNGNQLTKISKTFTATGDTTKMFTGTFPVKNADGTETEQPFTVSDKDAESLGWLIKEYFDWKANQEMLTLG